MQDKIRLHLYNDKQIKYSITLGLFHSNNTVSSSSHYMHDCIQLLLQILIFTVHLFCCCCCRCTLSCYFLLSNCPLAKSIPEHTTSWLFNLVHIISITKPNEAYLQNSSTAVKYSSSTFCYCNTPQVPSRIR